MKHLQGKTVWLKPTGNNRRRFGENQFKAELVKVARVNVILRLDGYHSTDRYRISDWPFQANYPNAVGVLSSSFNAGYVVYETEEQLQADTNFQHICDSAREIFNSYGRPQVTYEQALKLAEILNIKPPESDAI